MTHKTYKKVVLVVLDGFGIASYSHSNAIAMAQPQAIDFILGHFPSLSLQASGPLVGLPWGEVGNSEVGHLNIGAGRIVGENLSRINTAISDRSFFKNPALLGACEHVKKNQSRLHLAGMVSEGGVHSSLEHLYALLALAAEQKISEIYVHMFTDGRDTPEKVALDTIQKLKAHIISIGVNAKIATITGRFYGMDRGKHWDQTEMTYQAMVSGVGKTAASAEDAVLDSYNQGIFDEMIKPTVIVDKSAGGETHPVGKIAERDAVIFFNFRPDRAVQLTEAFVKPEIMDIPVKHQLLAEMYYATMTQYYFDFPVQVAFAPDNLENNLAQFLSKNKFTQYHIAESEKYAHVTSFFDGGKSGGYSGEEQVIVKSPNNANNYVDHPEMSGQELTDLLIDKIAHSNINFFLANFANADMVGHTGNLQAGIKAVQAIDRYMEKVMEAVLAAGAALIITADHGNIEEMLDLKTGAINKDHSTSPVPFLLVAEEFRFAETGQRNYLSLSGMVPQGVICDIAPTVLDLFGLPKPTEMTGVSLLGSILA